LGLEVNLGYNETAPYGFDTVALGFSDSIGGPTINSQVVSAVATDDFYVGIFGLGHQGTNISDFTEPHPSFLSVMKNESLIPSLSWGYTAGAPYRELRNSSKRVLRITSRPDTADSLQDQRAYLEA